MLGHLEDEGGLPLAGDFDGIVDTRKVAFEGNVHNRAENLLN